MRRGRVPRAGFRAARARRRRAVAVPVPARALARPSGSPLVVCRNVARDEGRGRVRPSRREATRSRARGAERSGPRGGRSRHGLGRGADRLPGQGARARRGDPRRRAERGVLVCGSGVGASVAACKLPGIRAAICHDTYSAHQGVEHDDMNVLCLGSEIVGAELAGGARARLPRGTIRRRRALCQKTGEDRSRWKGQAMAKSRLHELSERGQSRVDRLALARVAPERRPRAADARGRRRRRHLEPDDLPEGARRGGAWYDEQLREVLAEEDGRRRRSSTGSRSRTSRTRATSSGRVWDEGGGKDGYVSMEVDPTLAYDTDGTIEEAMRLHEWIDRPNLFVKIPATEPGLGAIEECIAQGRPINVTLIFSLERYAAVAEAYIRGLERLVESRRRPAARRLGGVSFFVSRVDTEADKRLEAIGRRAGAAGQARDREREARLRSATRRSSPGARWEALAAKGATTQRCLWASTSTKNPDLPRRAVRRGADRAGDGEHDAARDDRGLPGSRRRRRHARAGARRGAALLDELGAGRASTTTTSPTRSSGRACRSSPTRSRSCSTGSAPSRASSRRRDVTRTSSSGSGPATRRSGPTATRTAGSAGSTSSRGCATTSTS